MAQPDMKHPAIAITGCIKFEHLKIIELACRFTVHDLHTHKQKQLHIRRQSFRYAFDDMYLIKNLFQQYICYKQLNVLIFM